LFLLSVEKFVLTISKLAEDFLALSDVEKSVLILNEIGEDFLVLADLEKAVLILGESKLGESVLALMEESVLRGEYSCGRALEQHFAQPINVIVLITDWP
jgi:hypothetical protein